MASQGCIFLYRLPLDHAAVGFSYVWFGIFLGVGEFQLLKLPRVKFVYITMVEGRVGEGEGEHFPSNSFHLQKDLIN